MHLFLWLLTAKCLLPAKEWANMMWLWLHEGVSLQLLVPPV
jgi:hypothetical protein